MQRLSGVLLVLAGTALGAYMVLPPQHDLIGKHSSATGTSATPDSKMVSVVTAANAQSRNASGDTAAGVTTATGEAGGVRVFSPSTPLIAPTATAPSTSTWTAVVTSEAATNGKMTSSKPSDSDTRAALAGDLQRELKRVGCYAGEITGTWTAASKRAMSSFMERVNATLPVEEPDYILLTLVQGHTAMACGVDCPSGQVQSAAGKCVPQAVLAQATRKLQREDERRAAEDRKAQQQERLAVEQRAAEAQRLADAQRAAETRKLEMARAADAKRLAALEAQRKAAEAQKVAAAVIVPPQPKPAVRIIQAPSQQTAAVTNEQLPWLQDDARAPAQQAVSSDTPAGRSALPPGMMSVGGPRVITPDVPTTSVAAVAPVNPAASGVSTSTGAVSIDTSAAKEQPIVRQGAVPGIAGSKSGVAAQRPSRQAAIAGLPGSKSGVAIRPVTVQQPPLYTYRPAKIVRRPPPVVVYTPKPKSYYYASSGGYSGKGRRGQPRPGTMQFNIQQSLGGIY
jgi:hypothetical protein